MAEKSAIRVIQADAQGRCGCGEGEIIRLTLDVYGEPAHLVIALKDERAKLADMVPLARAVSARITEKVSEIVRLNGGTIPCCKGCSACCNYLVPLAIPEVFRLREEVLAMPVARQLIIEQGCLLAARRIVGKQPPASFAEPGGVQAAGSAAELLNTASSWYADFELSCPFLHNDICTIYEERPMVCREYSVSGSSRACGGGAGEPQVVCAPARMSEVLGRLASDLERTSVEALIMPLALIWADENRQRCARTWPARIMVERFIEIVCEELPKSSVEVLARV